MRRRKQSKPEEKYKYSSQEIVYSSGWVTEDFRLAEKQRIIDRNLQKDQKSQIFGEFLQIIDCENIRCISQLTRYIYSHQPLLQSALIENYQNLDRYLRSFQAEKINDDIKKSYEDYKSLEEKYQFKFEEFQSEMQEKLDFKDSQIRDLEMLINKLIKPPEIVKEYDDIHEEWQEFQESLEVFSPLDFEKIL